MLITKALRRHLVEKFNLSEDADDAAVNALVVEKLGPELTTEKLHELSQPEESEGGGAIRKLVTEEVGKAVKPIQDQVTAGFSEIKSLISSDPATTTDGDTTDPATQKAANTDGGTADEGVSPQQRKGLVDELFGGISDTVQAPAQPEGRKATGTPQAALAAGEGTGAGSTIRAKSIKESFDTTTKGAYYNQSRNPRVVKAFGDAPVLSGSPGFSDSLIYQLDHPSEFDKALAGSWFKFAVNSAFKATGRPVPAQYRMSELDDRLVKHAIHEEPFVGVTQYNENDGSSKFQIKNRVMNDMERKSLLDDSISGALEAAPIAFDSAVILTPLLHGELFPFVNLVNVPRGRRMEGFSMANPTFTWGTPEGTEVGLFNTDGFIAAFDTTIFRSTGAMPIGNDLESDSPTNLGAQVMSNYGQAALNTLDYVVANGNGTTQPEGVLNASGIATVNSDNGASGPWSIGDHLGLLFGVTKEYRAESDRNRSVYISNETTYQRTRNIKVDPASPSTDQRLAFAPNMDVESYRSLGHPHKIQQEVANATMGFFNLARYRMYRRLGLTVRIETGGKQLALSNETLIVVAMRLGGQLELGGAGAIIEDGQS